MPGRIRRWLFSVVVLALAAAGLALAPSATAAEPERPRDAAELGTVPVEDPQYEPAGCGTLTEAERDSEVPVARCFALGLATEDGAMVQNATAPPITAIGPAHIRSAYNLPDGGEGKTVAIVVAYGYSKAEADLAVFRSYWGLPPCTTENGCFTQMDQRGGTDLPPDDAGWSVEAALDVDAVSSACPKCNILLIHGDSARFDDLGKAVNTAAAQPGVVAISNSYGIDGETPLHGTYDPYFDHPGIAVTVASGDTGNVQAWPATNPKVTAVGGTTLAKDSSSTRGWAEKAWGAARAGTAGAGSGCSLYEPVPDWQQDVDTTCGAFRATADISAVADPATGLGVYNTVGQSGWSQHGGTSLSAPLVAGMYALAGAPTPDTYPAAYPYLAPGQFHDVALGTNGTCGTKLCQAGAGWDGPTGLGTPKGISGLTQGETGEILGNVTGAATHDGLAGVTMRATDSDGTAYTARTGTEGRYTLRVPPGTYSVSASLFGYEKATAADVVVTVDEQVTRDFALTTLPTRTVTGTVADASGQGWPMRAEITVEGQPGTSVFSDPYTGEYSLPLPVGEAYTLRARAADLSGYQPAEATVDLSAGTGAVTADIGMKIDPSTCVATGYGWAYDGTGTDFEGWSGKNPQAGWTITDAKGNGQTWAFEDPGGAGNKTGGSGNFAIVDSDYYKTGAGQDTSLVSPVIDLSDVAGPSIGFDTHYNGVGGQTGMIDYSIDGGQTWTNVWTKTSIVGVRGHVDIPIPAAANEPDVQVRFHFTGYAGAWWELDNVVIGGGRSCAAVPGGIVAGVVRDKNTGEPVDGATVTSDADPAGLGVAMPTPTDANLPDGYFWLFSKHPGRDTLTASYGRYTSDRAEVDIAAGGVTEHGFDLTAGRLTVDKATLDLTHELGESGSTTLTFGNAGTEPVHVRLEESEGGYTPMAGEATDPKGAPRMVVPATTSVASPTTASGANDGPDKAQVAPAAAPWSAVADYPGPVMDNAVASHAGTVYVLGGSDGSVTSAAAHAYDAVEGSWSAIAKLPEPLSGASAAFVGGTLYVAGGWNAGGGTSRHTYAYDPAEDTWTRVADLPRGLAVAGTAVVDGSLYVVGGCTTLDCLPTSQQVFGYDPATDGWTEGPAYPTPVAFTACGGVAGQVVCAGGVNADADQPLADTYALVPGGAAWTERASLPMDAWGAAAATANGQLQVMGGAIENGSAVTNQGYTYDPATDGWTALPNSNNAVYRGGAACGIYKVGGSTSGFNPVQLGETLPGYDQCGGDVSWLGTDKPTFDVAPGEAVTVQVATDADGLAQPGDYAASLGISTDTPYAADAVAVTMHAEPPASWGKVAGTVSDATGTALPGTVVQICANWSQKGGCGALSYTLRTDAAGTYGLWLDKSRTPLAVQVTKDGFKPEFTIVKIQKGGVSTTDFTLDAL